MNYEYTHLFPHTQSNSRARGDKALRANSFHRMARNRGVKKTDRRVKECYNGCHSEARKAKKDPVRRLNPFLRLSFPENFSGKDNPNEVTLLGLYSRKLLWFDDAKPTVFLFVDNIRRYAKNNGYNEDNVFGYVFIHEMMHAYYDAFESEGFPSREPIEEAFAEYGMLTFINKNKSCLPGDLLVDACKHVESKIKSGPSEYGFGFDLFEITKGGDVNLINLYMRKSNKIDLEVIRNWESDNKYFEDIKQYPNPVDADKCYKGVKEILYYDWKEPCFVIQPSIRGSRLSSGSWAASRKGYTIIDKSTSRILSKERYENHVPLFIIKDFCANHPGISLVDLQKIFGTVPNHTARGMSIIESAGTVNTYIATHPPKPGEKRKPRFFEDEPIKLSDGEIIMVTNQWADSGNVVNFEAFKKVAEDLGYIIK